MGIEGKRWSAVTGVTTNDSTTKLCLMQGNPLDNTTISKANFLAGTANATGAYTSGQTNTLITQNNAYFENYIDLADTATYNSSTGYTSAVVGGITSGYVTTGTTVNGHTLNTNITVSAHDTGAYTTGETDNKLSTKSETDHMHDSRYVELTGDTMSGTLTATNFILTSDRRLKENISEIQFVSGDVDYKQFEMKSAIGELRYGIIAQDLQEINPELVHIDTEGMLSVKYIDLLVYEIARLKEDVRELNAKIK